MLQFKPFKAIRYSESISNPAQVLAPPYDVISSEEQQSLYAQHSNNIVRLDLGLTTPTDTAHDNRYTRAKNQLQQWLVDGTLVRDADAAYYLYEHTYQADGLTKQLRGVLGAGQLFRFEEGVVLPHENTMPGPIQDRLDLTTACEANLSPIYTLFDDASGDFFKLTDSIWNQAPSVDLTTPTQDRYRIWAVTSDATIQAIFDFFAEKKLLIADGHHRYTTALHYREQTRKQGGAVDPLSDYTLLFATPIQNDGLTIYPTHRVIFDVPNFSLSSFKEKLAAYFVISEEPDLATFNQNAARTTEKVLGIMSPGGTSVIRLVLKNTDAVDHFFPGDASPVLKGLDVAILQYVILQGILGYTLEDIRQQKGIRYLKSTQAVLDTVANEPVQAVFVLQSTRLDEMRDVCLNGEKMPQKSTYFYPKLITGLVLNPVFSAESSAPLTHTNTTAARL